VTRLHEVLLDTDVFSEIVKGKNAGICRVASAYRVAFGTFTVSAVTVTENVRGWQRKGAATQLAKLIALLPDLDVRPLEDILGDLEGRAARVHS
jgi:tRNA(fMet)-specific endonuclease VapC